jgi:YHS domain-containing protein
VGKPNRRHTDLRHAVLHFAGVLEVVVFASRTAEDSPMNHARHFLTLAGLIVGIFFGSSAMARAGDQHLAIKGYDPVAYFTDKRAMVGSPQYQHEWDGAVYRFASAKHLELFKADPDRYLPQYHNWCAASVAKGEKVRPNPENWIVVDGRLYLFGKSIGPGLMRANPAAMKRQADKNWPTVSQLPDPPKE